MGFTFRVEYKAGRANVAADALSRRDTDEGMLFAISQPRVVLIDELRVETQHSAALKEIAAKIERQELGKDWSMRDSLIFYKD